MNNPTALPGAEDVALREAIARVIDPTAFKSHRSLYDYCIAQGDTMDEADKVADATHKTDCDKALAKADRILAIIPRASDEVTCCPDCNGRSVIETGEMENGAGGWGYETVPCHCEERG